MDFNTTIDIILKDLREVREIIDDLKNYPGLPKLQVELAKAKCRSAEEVIALLKTLQPDAAEQVTTSASPTPKEPVSEREAELLKPGKLIEISDEEEKVEVIEEEKKIVSELMEEPEKRDLQEAPHEDRKVSSTIIADRFSGSPGTFSDSFELGRKGEDLASVIKRTKPLGNLEDAIGISDKFLFIREIFKGNQSDYEQAIDKLNRAGTLPDAMAVIMSYTGENEESEVVQQLLEIVKRKLPSDG